MSTEPKTFGRWLGFDRIDYFERVIAPWGAPLQIAAEVSSGEDGAQALPGLGTVRYKVEVEIAGRTVASPGAEATDTFGVLPGVHRVSIRRGDDFLGWLTGYLLVPEVFGSAGGGRNHQTERFTGADCADVLVGALRRTGRTDLDYTNVEGLTAYAKVIAGPAELDDRGAPDHPIAGIRAGDLIRIDYAGAAPPHAARLGPRRRAVPGPQRSGRAVPRRTGRSARRLRSGDPHGPPAPGDRAARAPGAGDGRRAALATAVTIRRSR